MLFAVGATCFLVGPLPGFAEWVGPVADGLVFFVGSVFFTTAATLQWLSTINPDPGTPRRLVRWEPHRNDWWSSGAQLVGTVFFNLTTARALGTALSSPD